MTSNLTDQLRTLGDSMRTAASIADDVLTLLHELKREHPDDLATILALADKTGRVWVEATSTAAALDGRATSATTDKHWTSTAWSPDLHTRSAPKIVMAHDRDW